MIKKDAIALTGGLGSPSKMPGFAYGLSPSECKTGAKLRLRAGTVCSDCYACGGNYTFPSVKQAHANRLASLSRPEWVSAMSYLVGRETARIGQPWFRWHDSGDLQGARHLDAIADVCRATPTVHHWLPTKEKRIVTRWLDNNAKPDNLVIRLSATMIDGSLPRVAERYRDSIRFSMVYDKGNPVGYECPAPKQGGECGDCRACWDDAVFCSAYHRH
jgi:hypothetical protein